MSRSYKGMPIIKDGTLRSRRASKRLANKAVRRSLCVVNGKFYRKVHDSWNIYDYAFFGLCGGQLMSGKMPKGNG